jgi:hypothetical protein
VPPPAFFPAALHQRAPLGLSPAPILLAIREQGVVLDERARWSTS